MPLPEWHPPFSSFSSFSGVWGAKPLVFPGWNANSSFSPFSPKRPLFWQGTLIFFSLLFWIYFVAFLPFKEFLVFLRVFFTSFPWILGIRKGYQIPVILSVFLAFSQKSKGRSGTKTRFTKKMVFATLISDVFTRVTFARGPHLCLCNFRGFFVGFSEQLPCRNSLISGSGPLERKSTSFKSILP